MTSVNGTAQREGEKLYAHVLRENQRGQNLGYYGEQTQDYEFWDEAYIVSCLF